MPFKYRIQYHELLGGTRRAPCSRGGTTSCMSLGFRPLRFFYYFCYSSYLFYFYCCDFITSFFFLLFLLLLSNSSYSSNIHYCFYSSLFLGVSYLTGHGNCHSCFTTHPQLTVGRRDHQRDYGLQPSCRGGEGIDRSPRHPRCEGRNRGKRRDTAGRRRLPKGARELRPSRPCVCLYSLQIAEPFLVVFRSVRTRIHSGKK